MKLYYMKQMSLDALQRDISDNLSHYQSKDIWIEQYFINNETPNFSFDTGIDVEEYDLKIGGPETDFANSKIIYEAYRDKLNPVQASDLRLWAYLAHVKHWDYMNNRWKINAPDEETDNEEQETEKSTSREKAINRVKSRYFFGASRGKAFVRQGIARLYWSAYLTYDENNNNPYEYTEFFFSKQDIFTSITERSYARNKVLLLAALKELKKHPEISRDDTRLFLAQLNQTGAITVLDSLNAEQADNICSSIMSGIYLIPTVKEGSTIKAYNNMTGKAYGVPLKIVNGKVTAAGKPINTKPKTLIGKREGSNVLISGQSYVIKDIQ